MTTIPIKNKEGIAKMREACAIAATVLDSLKQLVRPGITTQDLEEAGRDFSCGVSDFSCWDDGAASSR